MIKILVVDDEKSTTTAYVNVLGAKGYDAKGALNSKQAFDALESYKPDIILLDINLREKVTGVDVLKKAVGLNPNVQTAVITGLGSDFLVEEALSAGAKKVIHKPTGLTTILGIINELSENVSK